MPKFSLIDRIVLTPNESCDDLIVDLHGDLAGIPRLSANRSLLEDRPPLDGSIIEESEIKQVRLMLHGMIRP